MRKTYMRTYNNKQNNMEKNSKYKDTTFDMFGTKWTIKYVDTILDEKGGESNQVGVSDLMSNIIKIRLINPFTGKMFPQEEIRLTLLHELVHVIFATGQYNDACNDEPIVEFTARSIRSLQKQRVI